MPGIQQLKRWISDIDIGIDFNTTQRNRKNTFNNNTWYNVLDIEVFVRYPHKKNKKHADARAKEMEGKTRSMRSIEIAIFWYIETFDTIPNIDITTGQPLLLLLPKEENDRYLYIAQIRSHRHYFIILLFFIFRVDRVTCVARLLRTCLPGGIYIYISDLYSSRVRLLHSIYIISVYAGHPDDWRTYSSILQ